MNKVALFLERFWLTIAIVSGCLAIYHGIATGVEDGLYFMVFTLIAVLLWYMRRRLRIKLKAISDAKESEKQE